MITQKENARELYMNSGKSIVEIADTIGVHRRSIHNWINEGEWKKLKIAALKAPAAIQEELYSQVSELLCKIRERDKGSRYAAKEEADTLRKLVTTIDKVKLQPSQGAHIQAVYCFCEFIAAENTEIIGTVSVLADKYLRAARKNGFNAFEIQYRADELIREDEKSLAEAADNNTPISEEA